MRSPSATTRAPRVALFRFTLSAALVAARPCDAQARRGRDGAPPASPAAGPANPASPVVPNTQTQPPPPSIPLPPPPPLTAAEASGEHFTLLDALTALTRAHPLLIAAEANTHAAEYDVVQAGLWTNPQLNGAWAYSLNQANYASIGYFSVGLTQFLELAGVPGARRRASEFLLQAVRAESDGVHRSLNYDVRTAFVTLTSGYARLQVLRETLVELERAESIVRARVNAGAAPHYDASRIAVALADARSAVAEAEADLVEARGTLNVAVGPLADSLHGTPVFDLFAEPPLPVLDRLLDAMRTTRPDIVAARRQADAAQAEISVARRSVLPGIAVNVGAGYGSATAVQGSNTVASTDIGVGVAMPIPVIDRGQGSIGAADARFRAAVANADAIQLADEQRVRSNYEELLSRRAALDAYRETGAADSAGMQREAEAGYREGRLSVLELVDAYLAVRDARLRYVTLATAARSSEVDLGRAIGALDPAMRAPGATLPIDLAPSPAAATPTTATDSAAPGSTAGGGASGSSSGAAGGSTGAAGATTGAAAGGGMGGGGH